MIRLKPVQIVLLQVALCLMAAILLVGCASISPATVPIVTTATTLPMATPTSQKLIARIDGQSPSPNTLAWSPDSSEIAVASSFAPLQIWDVRGQRLVASLPLKADKHGVSWSPDGKYLAVAALQPTDKLQIWDVRNKSKVFSDNPGSGATEVAWSPDGKQLAVAMSGRIKDQNFAVDGGAIYLYDPTSWIPTATITYTNFVGSISWAPDSSRLAFASTTGDLKESRVVTWDVANDKVNSLGNTLAGSAPDVSWSPDGKAIAVSTGEDSVVVIDPNSGQISRNITQVGNIIAVGWSPNSKRLAGAGQAGAVGEVGTISVWEVGSGALLLSLAHDAPLTSMAWSPDGKYLASTSTGDTLWVWDAR